MRNITLANITEAATGSFAGLVGQEACSKLPALVVARIRSALQQKQSLIGEDYYVGLQPGEPGLVFYVGADAPISLPDRRMIEMFNRNVALAHANLRRIAAPAAAPHDKA